MALRVARNVALDHMRRRRSLLCEEVYETAHQSDDSGDDRRRGLEQALESLPEEQRNVIVLRHLVGLTPGEIAVRMGRTESSIHGLHHRARQTLKRELMAIDCGPSARACLSARRGPAALASLVERELDAVADVQSHRARKREVPEDPRAAADRAGLDPAADVHDPRPVGDDRALDLGALDLGAGADRRVRADVGVRDASGGADDASARG